jgi:hypothetical protein
MSDFVLNKQEVCHEASTATQRGRGKEAGRAGTYSSFSDSFDRRNPDQIGGRFAIGGGLEPVYRQSNETVWHPLIAEHRETAVAVHTANRILPFAGSVFLM